MSRLKAVSFGFIILACIIGAVILNFPFTTQNADQTSVYQPEVWRSMEVNEAAKIFDATGSRTNFLAATSDDTGQHMILGVSHFGNGVPWIADFSTDMILGDPLFLAPDRINVPRPELFAANGNLSAFIQNTSAGEKGGGVYSDFGLFDRVANETARYYRFNFQAATSFHTRADIVRVDQSSGLQTPMRPFGERDARLTSLLSTASGFVAGGYVVLDGQFGAVPALVHWRKNRENAETLVLGEGFGLGSHWIDDIIEIDATRFVVVGASTAQGGIRGRDNIGWIAVVDIETGALTRIGESFPSHGRILLDNASSGFHVITNDQIMHVSLGGQIMWSVNNADTLKDTPARQFVPRSSIRDQNGHLWVAGSAVIDGWGAWITQISNTGEVVSGSFFRSSRNAPRFVDLLSADDGGVLATGSLNCEGSNCGSHFARGFILMFAQDGQIDETERARFDAFESRREERNFYNTAPSECTQIDRNVCAAVAETY